MTLEDLGPRICMLGPSNSGKSTLAAAIGHKLGHPPIHLDQLHHLPGTDWQQRDPAAFLALHDAAILGETWVIEGNYSRCLPQRLDRATGVILLDTSTATSLFRYFRRCWFEHDRIGALEGGRDSVKWLMLHHIAVVTPASRRRYAAMFETIALPKFRLASPAALTRFYNTAGLERPRR
ncbi:AAA family ATPase [Sphingomonas sp. HITSZ_GF]|uniref:AAA family ATPase n=1 Tax=Sphingomonas sp. HITSZ_GF TaxID=3037247 RepID=UPI00240CF518|nr:AAA family ATPase [Sphingomonas sp. HITSZ_GF]MDG2535967.1 AAA family ATPase [Sphingomonas sp. HITSZ_GF]